MAPAATKETFTVAVTVEDPMTAESLVETLKEGSIDAFVRARGSAGSDMLGAVTTGFGSWEILVPTASLEAASKLIDAELDALDAGADENARAAEEEALSGETEVPDKS